MLLSLSPTHRLLRTLYSPNRSRKYIYISLYLANKLSLTRGPRVGIGKCNEHFCLLFDFCYQFFVVVIFLFVLLLLLLRLLSLCFNPCQIPVLSCKKTRTNPKIMWVTWRTQQQQQHDDGTEKQLENLLSPVVFFSLPILVCVWCKSCQKREPATPTTENWKCCHAFALLSIAPSLSVLLLLHISAISFPFGLSIAWFIECRNNSGTSTEKFKNWGITRIAAFPGLSRSSLISLVF